MIPKEKTLISMSYYLGERKANSQEEKNKESECILGVVSPQTKYTRI